MKTAENKPKADLADKILRLVTVGAAAFILLIIVFVIVGLNTPFPDGDYSEFTPLLKRSIKSTYDVDVPDSAIMDEGKYYVTTWQSTDRRVVKIVFRINRDDLDGLFVGKRWKQDGNETRKYTFSDGRHNAVLYVYDAPGYSKDTVLCSLEDVGDS